MQTAFPSSDYYENSVAILDIQCHLSNLWSLRFITLSSITYSSYKRSNLGNPQLV